MDRIQQWRPDYFDNKLKCVRGTGNTTECVSERNIQRQYSADRSSTSELEERNIDTKMSSGEDEDSQKKVSHPLFYCVNIKCPLSSFSGINAVRKGRE